MSGKIFKRALLGLVALAAGIQFVQPERANPPSDPASSFEALVRPAPEAAAVIRRACENCHSNHTVWPWYGWVAPASWFIADDIKDGRAQLNLSEWNRPGQKAAGLRLRAMCKEAREGDMPLWQYKLLHPESRLTAGDVSALCSIDSTQR